MRTFAMVTIVSLVSSIALQAYASCPSRASVLDPQPYAQGQSQLIAECTTVIQMSQPHGQPDLCVYSGTDSSNGSPYFLFLGSDPNSGWDSKVYENNKVMSTSLSISSDQYVGTYIRQCGDIGLHNCNREIVTYGKNTHTLTDELDSNSARVPALFTKWAPVSKDIYGCAPAFTL